MNPYVTPTFILNNNNKKKSKTDRWTHMGALDTWQRALAQGMPTLTMHGELFQV